MWRFSFLAENGSKDIHEAVFIRGARLPLIVIKSFTTNTAETGELLQRQGLSASQISRDERSSAEKIIDVGEHRNYRLSQRYIPFWPKIPELDYQRKHAGLIHLIMKRKIIR